MMTRCVWFVKIFKYFEDKVFKMHTNTRVTYILYVVCTTKYSMKLLNMNCFVLFDV